MKKCFKHDGKEVWDKFQSNFEWQTFKSGWTGAEREDRFYGCLCGPANHYVIPFLEVKSRRFPFH